MGEGGKRGEREKIFMRTERVRGMHQGGIKWEDNRQSSTGRPKRDKLPCKKKETQTTPQKETQCLLLWLTSGRAVVPLSPLPTGVGLSKTHKVKCLDTYQQTYGDRNDSAPFASGPTSGHTDWPRMGTGLPTRNQTPNLLKREHVR